MFCHGTSLKKPSGHVGSRTWTPISVVNRHAMCSRVLDHHVSPKKMF